MFLAADSQAELTLIAGAALLYAAGRTGAEALAAGIAAPPRRALGHWLPIAILAVAAVLFHQQDLALAVIYATSVAALSLIGGCVAIMGSAASEPPLWPAPTRKAAALLLPVTVLTFLAGFSGHLGWLAACVLAAEGAAICLVRLDPHDRSGEAPAGPVRRGRLILAILVSVIGAWTAVKGLASISLNMNLPPTPVVVTMALSPLLVAPLLLGGSTLALRGQAWAAHGSHIGLAQLNLCGLLPLTALIWHWRWGTPLIYPMAHWRVDAVMLMLLSVALLPSAAGRGRVGRLEGCVLLGLYAGYVLAVIAVMTRA